MSTDRIDREARIQIYMHMSNCMTSTFFYIVTVSIWLKCRWTPASSDVHWNRFSHLFKFFLPVNWSTISILCGYTRFVHSIDPMLHISHNCFNCCQTKTHRRMTQNLLDYNLLRWTLLKKFFTSFETATETRDKKRTEERPPLTVLYVCALETFALIVISDPFHFVPALIDFYVLLFQLMMPFFRFSRK